MKKGLLATLLVSAGVLSLGLVPTNAHAADETNLEITINPDEGSKPGEEGLPGKLAIAWIPSSMNFGTHTNTGKAPGQVTEYEDTLTKPTFLAVSDDRDPSKTAGNLPAWDTTVQLSNFTVDGSTEENAEKLLGAELKFNTGAVQDYALVRDVDGNITSAPDPATTNVLKPHTGNDITASEQVITVAAGKESVSVLSKTAPNKVKGAYATEITNKKLKVALPQDKAGKKFTAKLTWSLTNTL